jgi:hypothetical protein
MVGEHGLGKREKNLLQNKKIPPYNKNSPPEKQNKIIPLFAEHRKISLLYGLFCLLSLQIFPLVFRFSELPSLVPFPQTTNNNKDSFKEL